MTKTELLSIIVRWWDIKDARKHGYNPPPDPWVGPAEKPPSPPKTYVTQTRRSRCQ